MKLRKLAVIGALAVSAVAVPAAPVAAQPPPPCGAPCNRPAVTVGNTYLNVNLTGYRAHLDITNYQGPCDRAGYIIPLKNNMSFQTMSSISLGNAANGWSILNCSRITLYVHDALGHRIAVLSSSHRPIMSFGIWDNSIRDVGVSA